jgi:cellobiose transport system permease protein
VATTLEPDRTHPSGRAAPPVRRRRGVVAVPYLFVAPFFVVFGVFGFFPLLYTVWVSLHEWSILRGDEGFVGLDNFARLAVDPRFWNATFNTFSIWLLSTVPQLVLALVLAAVLNNQLLRWRTGFRMSVLVPNITSVVAVGVIFTQIFGRDFGLANALLELLGLERVDWQSGRWSSHLVVSWMVMWRWTGYNALIYLAAMQTIPRSLYESAQLDGAGRYRQLVSVTIPQLRPTIIFTVIVSTIGGLQIFAEPLIFGGQAGVQGGNDRQFQTLTLFLYEQGFRDGNFGYAAAIAWALFLLILVFSVINYRLSTAIAKE